MTLDFDPCQDTPVEILHTILLGMVKYFWCDAVGCLSDSNKEILKAHLSSMDVAGLGLSSLTGQTVNTLQSGI